MDREAKQSVEWVHEGKYAAKVEVVWHQDDSGWSPALISVDVEKLDRVQIALGRGDIKAAADGVALSNVGSPHELKGS